MKRNTIKIPELLYSFTFLIYLIGSALTHIENGAELSLWLMVFAVISAAATTLLPWLGIQWLKLEEKGWRHGYWLAMLLQAASWGTFGYALLLRLERNLPPFHTWITLTTLLWAIWLWVFIYSRHAFRPQQTDDTLEDTQPAFSLDKKCEE
jgi:hypothetical protein